MTMAIALSAMRLNNLSKVMQLVHGRIRIPTPCVWLQTLCFGLRRNTASLAGSSHRGPGLTSRKVADPYWILFAFHGGSSQVKGRTLSW